MYRPRSHISDIGDVEIIEYGGQLHMFHLVIPNRDLVAHAISGDGLSWKALPPAIRSGDPGDWDDDMIRTVSVTAVKDRFIMLYSATCRRDGGRVERMCGAVSADLMHWEKMGEVSGIAPDPVFYEDERSTPEHVPWRDPKPFYKDSVYYCLLCARENHGANLRRGAVALLLSTDMIHWEQREPLYAPKTYMEIECPQVYEINGSYYLIGSIMEDLSQRYWRADRLEGPYSVAGGTNLLMPERTHYAGRITRFQGRDVFACWTFTTEDGPSPFGLRVTPGAVIKYVPAVLDVRTDTEGRLTLHSPAAWDRYRNDCGKPLFSERAKRLYSNPYASTGGRTLSSPSGMELLAAGEIHSHFTLDCRLRISGYRAGLAFYADEEGCAYLVELYPHENRVRLVRHFAKQTPQEHVWFDYAVLAQAGADLKKLMAEGLSVTLRAVNGEIELSLDGCVVISTVSTRCMSGRVGLFADNADISIDSDYIASMRVPENR